MEKTEHGIPFDMTVDELIDELRKAKEEHGGGVHVRLMEYGPASDRYDVGVQLCLVESRDDHWLKELVPLKPLMQDEIDVGFN